ncbi:hypothetical protein A8926_3460 [Saccharopolyspora spinosa]|uniref:Uncharacterized protein n=1 Tax=Saccharopolyspora spinosa TaxID=60894 RepID=A0A2N3XYM5_SACSN|nr:hypothetical protein A8926_3460 [Saccharopolyspora spinosa]
MTCSCCIIKTRIACSRPSMRATSSASEHDETGDCGPVMSKAVSRMLVSGAIPPFSRFEHVFARSLVSLDQVKLPLRTCESPVVATESHSRVRAFRKAFRERGLRLAHSQKSPRPLTRSSPGRQSAAAGCWVVDESVIHDSIAANERFAPLHGDRNAFLRSLAGFLGGQAQPRLIERIGVGAEAAIIPAFMGGHRCAHRSRAPGVADHARRRAGEGPPDGVIFAC